MLVMDTMKKLKKDLLLLCIYCADNIGKQRRARKALEKKTSLAIFIWVEIFSNNHGEPELSSVNLSISKMIVVYSLNTSQLC